MIARDEPGDGTRGENPCRVSDADASRPARELNGIAGRTRQCQGRVVLGPQNTAAGNRVGEGVEAVGAGEQAEADVDNLRAAFGWSRENSDVELALALASSLQPLWLGRGRIREGRAWLDASLADLDAQPAAVATAVRARALADKAVLATVAGTGGGLAEGPQLEAAAKAASRWLEVVTTSTMFSPG